MIDSRYISLGIENLGLLDPKPKWRKDFFGSLKFVIFCYFFSFIWIKKMIYYLRHCVSCLHQI